MGKKICFLPNTWFGWQHKESDILQKTDKLGSDWDEDAEFSKYPQIFLSDA